MKQEVKNWKRQRPLPELGGENRCQNQKARVWKQYSTFLFGMGERFKRAKIGFQNHHNSTFQSKNSNFGLNEWILKLIFFTVWVTLQKCITRFVLTKNRLKFILRIFERSNIFWPEAETQELIATNGDSQSVPLVKTFPTVPNLEMGRHFFLKMIVV